MRWENRGGRRKRGVREKCGMGETIAGMGECEDEGKV